MTHSSGLGSYFNETFMGSSLSSVQGARRLQAARVPGPRSVSSRASAYSYSNTGMFLLGPIVEKVTGDSYFEHVRKAVHEPAGMPDTDCYEMDRPVENLAIGYTRQDGEWFNNLYAHVIKGGPAGGGFSTVRDLLAFDQALRKPDPARPGPHRAPVEPQARALLTELRLRLPRSRRLRCGRGRRPQRRAFPASTRTSTCTSTRASPPPVMSNYDGGASLINGKIRELLARVEG